MGSVTPPNAAKTKSRLLKAAEAEFSEKGLAGARVDRIAARAKTNKQMLYYYFGSKEGIFREVLHRRTITAITENRDNFSWIDPHEVGEYFARLAALKRDFRILMWEALELRGHPLINETERRAIYEGWENEMRDEQTKGELPADINVSNVLLCEMALLMFPLAFPQITKLATGRSPNDPTFVREWTHFLEWLVTQFQGAGSAES